MKLKITHFNTAFLGSNQYRLHRKIIFNSIILMLMLFISSFTFKEKKELENNIIKERCKNPLLVALKYNAFVNRNLELNNGDSEGPIALGNNLIINGIFTVAAQNPGINYSTNKAYSLLVNGKVLYKGGEGVYLNNGYVSIGNLNNSSIYTRDNNNTSINTRITSGRYDSKPRIQLQHRQVSEIVKGNQKVNFKEAFTELRYVSSEMSKLPKNNKIGLQNKIKLFPNKLNVINVKGNLLKSLQNITFENKPNNKTPLIINIDAKNNFFWDIPNLAGLGDTEGAFIIWNFYNASKIELNGGGSLIGSILAPKAKIIKNSSGNVNGQIISFDYIHKGGELHYQPFDACVSLREKCNLSVDITTDIKSIACGVDSIILTAEVLGESSCELQYEWSTGAITSSINATQGGMYTVKVKGCDTCTALTTICISENANPLSATFGYNAFVKGNVTLTSGDSEGAIALGNDLTINGIFAVAAHTAGSNFIKGAKEATSLLVNGRVIYKSGEGIHLNNGFVNIGNTKGSVIYTRDSNNAEVNTRITPSGYDTKPNIQLHRRQPYNTVVKQQVLNFKKAFSRLEEMSLKMNKLSSNIKLGRNNRLKIIPNQVNILNIKGTHLSNLPYITFDTNLNKNTPLIINVDANGSFSWGIPNFAGLRDQDGAFIIWNFYNTTKLTLNGGGSVVGNILAPKATVIKNSSGNINGQLIAANYFHKGGELHNYVFNACIEINSCEPHVSTNNMAKGEDKTKIVVYPTKVYGSDNISIRINEDISEENVEISIYNFSGIKIGATYSKRLSVNKEVKINLSTLGLRASEIYLIKIDTRKKSITRRIIIK